MNVNLHVRPNRGDEAQAPRGGADELAGDR
jgi:hypothetical protein